MKVTLLNHTNDPEFVIGQMAGICYGSQTDDRYKNIKRASHCVEKGHLATLRFAYATFHVKGISRVCSHQFVRSKHLDFLQRSQRYCNESKSDFLIPESLKDGQIGMYEHAVNNALSDYNTLLEWGVKKEDARMILPQCVTTELIVTGNFQAWIDFIRLRNTKEAQAEIRHVAIEIKNKLSEIAPHVFQ